MDSQSEMILISCVKLVSIIVLSGTSEMGIGPYLQSNSHASSLKRKAEDMEMDNGNH